MPSEYSPTSDADVETTVRALTGYETDELDASRFQSLLDLTKLTLINETSVDPSTGDDEPWYDDEGLAQAVLFTTAIRVKCAVENYSVDRWDFGDQTLDVRGAGDADQVQFERWMVAAANGIDASAVAEDDTPSPSNTASYIT